MPLEYDDITPTDEQAAILDAFEAGKHIAVLALAGTGKTSTLRMCGETVRRRKGAYLAFNRAIADEATDTFPMRVECRTAHSFAFKGLGHRYQHRINGPRMPPWEVAKHLGIDPIAVGDHLFNQTRVASLVREMVGKFCYSSDEFLTVKHVPFVRGLETTVREDGSIKPDEHAILAPQLVDYAKEYWDDIRDLNGRFRFEHDHYLKLWCLTHPTIPGDFLLLDEAQDLNGVLVGLVEDQEHMQIVVVGDANQQIYQWRGSLNAMEVFPVDLTLPLTQSWRFGPEIAGAANVFLEMLDCDLRISGNPDKESRVGPSDAPDAILCRTNAGGLEIVLWSQNSGKKVHFAGGRPGEIRTFCEAVQKMQAGQITTHPDLQAFSSWNEVVDYTKSTGDKDFAMMVKLIERYGVDRILDAMKALVPQSKADITVSTGHSAKGLEWNEVRLGYDYEPEEDRVITEAENRLRYVSVTRAKTVLDPGPLDDIIGQEADLGGV